MIIHGEEFKSRRERRRGLHELTRFYCGSKNVQQTDSKTSTSVADSRKAVGDQGILAEDSFVDQSVNDFRTFDDHSVFEVDGSDRSVTNTTDARDFSDHSSFAVDASDRSVDNSVTNITSNDAEIAKANADAAVKAFEVAGGTAVTIADKSLGLVSKTVEDAFDANREVTTLSLDAVSQNNLKAFDFAAGAGSSALAAAEKAFAAAAEFVAKDAADSRDFAGQFVGRVFDSAKSADQQNVETITNALTKVAVAAAIVFGLRALKRK